MNRPEPGFYPLHVLEADTELLVHSVAEVITSEGDLFDLVWCPDIGFQSVFQAMPIT